MRPDDIRSHLRCIVRISFSSGGGGRGRALSVNIPCKPTAQAEPEIKTIVYALSAYGEI